VTAVLEAAARRADQAEVFAVRRVDTTVSFAANRLKTLDTRESQGTGLRLVKDGRIGLASATHADDPEGLVGTALESAAIGPQALFELPDRLEGPAVDTYDPAVEQVEIEEMVALGQALIDRVRRENGEVSMEGVVSRQVIAVEIANSRGGHRAYRKSVFGLDFEGLLLRGTDMLWVGEGESGCRPVRDTGPIADAIIEQLTWARQNTPIPTKAMPVLFTPLAAISTLIAPLLMGLNGRTVLQGTSPLAEKRGQALFDPRFSMWDDPTEPYRPGSGATDDEGVASRRNTLVDRGVVGGFLYDLQTAAEAGEVSTGSATRGVDSLPSPSTRCLFVGEGDTPLADLIAGMKEGLIADALIGAGQGNTMGGEFSGNVVRGYRVENGAVIGRVKDTMISGNAYEALRRVRAISRETRWLGGSLHLPYFLIEDVSVASKS
jgi:PmbA protein